MTAARRRLPLLAALLFATALPTGCGGSSGPVDGGAAYRHLQALVAIGPRPFGSPELGKAADYITAELDRIGLKAVPQDVILETYEMMRPGRVSDAGLLAARAEMLRRDYGAHAIAALIDEAVAVYERRNLFRRRY